MSPVSAAGPFPTILDVLKYRADATPQATAIDAEGRAQLTYEELVDEIDDIAAQLRTLGVRPADRIAIVLPDGVEAALTFLGVSSCAVAAPLNPACAKERFGFYLTDLPARAVIVPAGAGGAAADAARSLGIPIIELAAPAAGSVFFTLASAAIGKPVAEERTPSPDDTALLLYTSGTTARPKLVPLTHRNINAAAAFTAQALELTPSDRGLNVVSMFHTHGLVSALLAPLAAGSTIVFPAGFAPGGFVEAIVRLAPTWYTAVPAIHQAIVDELTERGTPALDTPLRFVRSSAAMLPTVLRSQLEHAFGAPVLDGYGMTEAAPIIACTPLSRPGKPGSVGLAAGPDVAIMDEQGHLLNPDRVGEVVVRGANVMAGYERDPQANADAFVRGWFRTGDQGYLDADGFLFLTGRIKEIINRGGEKVSPAEIEEVLLGHPGVKAAAVFAIPDRRLGETVGAAVVKRAGVEVTERELRAHVGDRRAFFKIPRRIVFVDHLPTSDTGKPMRIGLAARLGIEPDTTADEPRAREPRNCAERDLVAIWRSILQVDDIKTDDNFFVLGGDSITVVEMLSMVQEHFENRILPEEFFNAPTVAGLARLLGRSNLSSMPSVPTTPAATMPVVEGSMPSLLVPLNEGGSKSPIFVVHLGGAGEALVYRHLAVRLADQRPLYGIQADGDWRGRELPYRKFNSVAELAARYVDEIRHVQPHGPYHLAGGSFGGIVAFEMAQQLVASGERVHSLIVFDSHVRNNPFAASGGASVETPAAAQRGGAKPKQGLLARCSRAVQRQWPFVHRYLVVRKRIEGHRSLVQHLASELQYQWRLWRKTATVKMASQRFLIESELLLDMYEPRPYAGAMTLVRASAGRHDSLKCWLGLVAGGITVHDLPGGHIDMFEEPIVAGLAEVVRETLNRAERAAERRSTISVAS